MTDAVDLIVDAAESERKYWGSKTVNVLHLAVALSKRSPEVFAEVFGDAALQTIKDQLRSGSPAETDHARFEAVVQEGRQHTGMDDIVRAMATALRAEFPWAFTAPPGGIPGAAQSPHPAGGGNPPSTPDDTSKQTNLSGTACFTQVAVDTAAASRATQVDEILVMLSRHRPATPLLVGREGSGRTTLVRSLAARLANPDARGRLAGTPVLELNPRMRSVSNLPAEISKGLEALTGPAVVCVDDLEVLLGVSRMGFKQQLLDMLRRAIDHPHARFVFTIDEALLGELTAIAPEFVASLSPVTVALGSAEDTAAIIQTAAAALAAHHGVEVPQEIVDIAAATAPRPSGPVHPGFGISAIDSACVRCVLRAGTSVAVHDLRRDEGQVRRVDYPGLCDALRRSVIGQDPVIERVASRLALTRAGLDLRPERPDGVFLFVGPTGVGKTELARAVSREMFGHAGNMIRLDMSEYVHDWSVSRLIGPMPGYVGSTDPTSWLTTRVAKTPGCVLLLDEIEKAHPVVWNVFLQVFDAGRLTDSRGEIIDFSHVIVIMTSNLGAEAYSRRRTGFGLTSEPSAKEVETEVAELIRGAFSPELLNRMDDTLMFRPLDAGVIRQIAEHLVRDQIVRIAGRGYELTVDDDVIEHLAVTGYEPAFGARHLQRNVERRFLMPLALAGDGTSFHATLAGGSVHWLPKPAEPSPAKARPKKRTPR